MIYEYYPFGMLMPGRSLDTAGLCTTTPVYTEIPHYHWANGGTLSSAGGGGASAYGSVTKTNLSNGGISVSGTSGGVTFTISGIPSAYISIQPSLSALIGSTTLTVYPGTATSGTSLGSANITFTSPTASIYLPAGGSTSAPATITVKMEFPSGGSTNSMTIDSIGYQWITLSLGTTLYTQCGSPKDKYEFGFNGQMKSNEIAGIGNHNTALFWEYDTRLGRRWNLDPVNRPWESRYSVYSNNAIINSDFLGDEWTVSNDEKTISDVHSLVAAVNQKYISINTQGNVEVNFAGISEQEKSDILAKDEGLSLVYDLFKSRNRYYYAASDYALLQTETFHGCQNAFLYTYATYRGMGSVNASENGLDALDEHTYYPMAGYNGQVVIHPNVVLEEEDADGISLDKPRSAHVFHELAENYLRTEIGVNYNDKGTTIGAHNQAIHREEKWNRKSSQPGEFIRARGAKAPTEKRKKEIAPTYDGYMRPIGKMENK